MDQLHRLGVFFDAGRPDLILSEKDNAIAFGRNGRLISLGDLTRSAAGGRNDPDVLLDAFGQTGRVWVIAMGFEIAAANEQNRTAVGSPSDLIDLLAVIIAVVGKLPALVIRGFSGPEVACAFLVQHPSHSAALRSRGKVGRERRAHNLLERETFR